MIRVYAEFIVDTNDFDIAKQAVDKSVQNKTSLKFEIVRTAKVRQYRKEP